MDPILGGSLLSTAGSLFGNMIGNQGRRKAEARANAQNIKFWNMQNAYNTPSAQMQRFKDAGLNPNLIYGKGTPGNAEQITGAKAPDYEMDNPLSDITNFADIKSKDAQKNNLNANTANVSMDTLIKAQNLRKTTKEADNVLNYSAQMLEQDLRKKTEDATISELNRWTLDQTKTDKVLQELYKAKQAKQDARGSKYEADIKKRLSNLSNLFNLPIGILNRAMNGLSSFGTENKKFITPLND